MFGTSGMRFLFFVFMTKWQPVFRVLTLYFSDRGSLKTKPEEIVFGTSGMFLFT